MKKELSVNELLWLSMEAVGKCPYCDTDVTVGANNVALQMGMTFVHPDGRKEKIDHALITECPKCQKTIKLDFSVNMSKKED